MQNASLSNGWTNQHLILKVSTCVEDECSAVNLELSDGEEGYEYEEEYVLDEDYDGPVHQSQACRKRGICYTPPGWKKILKIKRKAARRLGLYHIIGHKIRSYYSVYRTY